MGELHTIGQGAFTASVCALIISRSNSATAAGSVESNRLCGLEVSHGGRSVTGMKFDVTAATYSSLTMFCNIPHLLRIKSDRVTIAFISDKQGHYLVIQF